MEQLTGDALAARLFAEQGYLVVSHHEDFPSGVPFRARGSMVTETPLIVRGKATRREYAKQIKRACQLTGSAD